MVISSDLGLVIAATCCAVLACAVRAILWRQFRRGPSTAALATTPGSSVSLPGSSLALPPETAELTPAELAYLARDGDMTHTMIVLVADLVQRVVKSGSDIDKVALRPYESAIIGNVKELVKKWADNKISEVVPIADLKNPLRWLVRIRALKAFFGETLRNFVREFIKDPLHIKRYFSWSGIVRFAVNLCTTSARAGVELSLRGGLEQRGFLINAKRRDQFALALLAIAPLMVISTYLLIHSFLGTIAPWSILFLLSLGIFNAIVVRTILALPSLIPSYDEFHRIAMELPRSGKRMTFVRGILRASRLLILWVTIVFICTALLLEFLIHTQLIHLPAEAAIALLLAATITSLPIIQAVLDWHSLSTRDHASQAGLDSVAHMHKRVSEVGPLNGLKSMLSDPQYDPMFSEILAIYGIETLWLLS